MLLKLYDHLKNNGIDVYFVGQHQRDCTSNYVVLKDGGQISENGKVGKKYLDILFFIPKNQFSLIDSFKKLVMSSIKEFNKLRYTGQETSIVADNDKKALTFSVLYQVEKKLEG